MLFGGKYYEFVWDNLNSFFVNFKRDGILKFEFWELFIVIIYKMLVLVEMDLSKSLIGRG